LNLSFLGAANTVTGSRYLVETPGSRVLVDCGLFQGLKQLRLRNRAPFPVPPADIAGIVLTHAHLDHTGYLPALARDGFHGPVYATSATCDLCGILLLDSGHLQEQEAELANRYGYSRHHPALPLYTRADAERALELLVPVSRHQAHRVGQLDFRFTRAGHILGASSVELSDGRTTVVFSGDLGRPNDALALPPEPVRQADYLIVESTYGNRLHPVGDPEEALGDVIRRTVARGGAVVIPAFAVGRAQTLLLHIHRLAAKGAIPDVPVFLDSPMAADVTRLLQAHADEHRISREECAQVSRAVDITNSVEESKAIDRRTGPLIVISASGMATGGRVLFHLERFLPDRRSTVLLVGHQAAGTRGEQLLNGAEEIKIRGKYVAVHAEVVALNGLSAHADYNEILEWLRGFERAPLTTFVTHGEPSAADALRQRIEDSLGWTVHVPEHGERVKLAARKGSRRAAPRA
jgi:metallo-beta-lactamase family protein